MSRDCDPDAITCVAWAMFEHDVLQDDEPPASDLQWAARWERVASAYRELAAVAIVAMREETAETRAS